MLPAETIRPEEQYYIVATSAPTTERALVLKDGDMFSVFDHFGDVDAAARQEEGLYYRGTRFVSGLRLTIANGRPLLLSATVRQDNRLMGVDLANPDIYFDQDLVIPRGTLHIYRSKFLRENVCHERIRIRNFALTPASIRLRLEFSADFADIFEVRGLTRKQRGVLLQPVVQDNTVTLSYRGLDGVVRRTVFEFSPAPDRVTASAVDYLVELEPKQEIAVELSFECGIGESTGSKPPYSEAFVLRNRSAIEALDGQCHITSPNGAFDAWLERSRADLSMMVTNTPYGPYPYAGVPWFSVPFGRDGVITALECLWMAPEIAKGVLSYLSATQAMDLVPEQDAEPGKILHETREGEMAALGEIPFARYYGSVDSTPLFLMLAGAYYERTVDLAFIKSIWPNIERAVGWLDDYGDIDGDGFVEYHRRNPKGLVQQGWKDSQDSVFHADGTLAEGPIALCEVQGYAFAGRMSASMLAEALGHTEYAAAQRSKADQVKKDFVRTFWCDEIGTYALALDRHKRPCRVRTSNPGHCLYAGIAAPEHVRIVANDLMSRDFATGWGIRTLAQNELRYNPMSYHNGSVWPHDNALIGAGFGRCGMNELAAKVLDGLFEASTFFDLHRLPELFCGFDRRPGKGPTLYPVACAPQTWAAAAGFCLIQACTGLAVDAMNRRLVFTRPVLPRAIERLHIRDLRAGDASVDLVIMRSQNAVSLNVEKRKGDLDVLVLT
jgi:glycogen debranching enzyme